mgnify:CR=1 FL=1
MSQKLSQFCSTFLETFYEYLKLNLNYTIRFLYYKYKSAQIVLNCIIILDSEFDRHEQKAVYNNL